MFAIKVGIVSSEGPRYWFEGEFVDLHEALGLIRVLEDYGIQPDEICLLVDGIVKSYAEYSGDFDV